LVLPVRSDTYAETWRKWGCKRENSIRCSVLNGGNGECRDLDVGIVKAARAETARPQKWPTSIDMIRGQVPWQLGSYCKDFVFTLYTNLFLKNCCAGCDTLWHLRKFLQCIKYIILEFTLFITFLYYSPPPFLE
jgi:hypothetical protein